MRWLCSILLLGMLPSLSAFSDENAQKALQQATDAFDRLNVVLVKSGYKPLIFDPSTVTISPAYDFKRKINLLELQAASGPFVHCLPSTGDVLFIETHIPYAQGASYDQPPPPAWSKERAISMARSYAEAAFKKFPVNAGAPQTNFAPTMDFPKYYEGEWHIRWPRIDKSGRGFQKDSLDVFLSETKGFRYAYFDYFSKYQEPTQPLISKDEAVKLSKPAAESLLNSKLTASWGLNGLQLANCKSVLWIVNPNHIFQWKSVNDAATASDTTAKLAWWVEYQTTPSGSTAVTGHLIDIWIDAQTKEVLGGDFK